MSNKSNSSRCSSSNIKSISSSFYATRHGGQQRRQLMLQQLLLPLLLLGWCRFCCSSASKASDIRDNRALAYLQGMHKLCGHALNIALDAVCYDTGYNTLGKRRAADANTLTETSHHPGYQLSSMLSNLYGTEVLIKSRRLRRQNTGIHEECCLKACSYYELRAYCRQKE
ncbi:probable insulin-like peptide 1 [Drosophila albomicans]|uniref:Probable insulin-like peptide 1 n=1 Tax=Drosophila albomicans TaxID=7291 RepID=A0A6P8X4K4_DROAB|nr:probable insulin-like peptide 1 [Drosophila albomicans]